jgi:DHA1 family bicyclomycin/chloramphenicol resistance-like MFS transporter
MNRFRANPVLLAPLIAGLAMLGPFAIDTFFPAFPVMAEDLGITQSRMQLSLSAYLGAFALMSLVHGPLSDAYGRRGVIVWSLVAFLLATIGCALAPSFEMLIACRVLQGASAGAGMIVGRAIVRDRFDGAEAQRLMSKVTLIFGVAPAIAPVLGGFILSLAGWRAIFWALAAFVALLALASLGGLPETHPRERRTRLAIAPLAQTYSRIVGDRRFVLLALTASFNFGALFTYIAAAPAMVLNLLHLNERQFAWLFFPAIGGMMIGSALSGRLAGRLSGCGTVRLGYALMGSGVAINLVVAASIPPHVPWSVLPISVFGCGVSLAFPTLTLMMLDRFPTVRGAAASVQAALSLGYASLVSGLIAPFVSHSAMTLALAALAQVLAGYVCWHAYRRLGHVAGPSAPVASDREAALAEP